MSKKIIPLITTHTMHVLTPSKLEVSEIVSDQEFSDNFQQGKYFPISESTSGKGEVSMEPTFYDRRDGMRCSFVVKSG